MKSYRCICAFAEDLGETSPYQFPRVGMADNVLYRGRWIVQHAPSGQQAVIGGNRGTLAPEAAECCPDWFTRSEERRVGKECRARWSRDH